MSVSSPAVLEQGRCRLYYVYHLVLLKCHRQQLSMSTSLNISITNCHTQDYIQAKYVITSKSLDYCQCQYQMSGFSGVKMELLDTVKARKLAYYGHIMRKHGSCQEKEIMQGTMPGACGRGRPRTAWMDNIKTWTGLSVEESIRMTEDRDKWRKYVHGVANPRTEDG